MRAQSHFVLSLSALGLLSLPQTANADRGRNPLAGQPAIRHRLELRKLRFEITPQFMISTNQPFLISMAPGVNLQFHITDWLGIGASYHYNIAVKSPLAGRIEEALPTKYPAVDDPAFGLKQPDKTKFLDHLIGPEHQIGVYATLTPVGGKFSLFNALSANYDFYGLVGGGIVTLATPLSIGTAYKSPSATNNDVNTQSSEPLTGVRGAGVFGVGAHLFFNDFLALQLELRDYLYKSNPGGLDVNTTDGTKAQGTVLTGDDEYITNNLYFGIGLSIFLPPKAKVLDKRTETSTYVPTGQKPAEEAKPVEGDKDGDGIADKRDKCPDEAEDKDGFEDNDGCPDPDNDKDGVLDADDRCPMQAGSAENQGCPDKDTDGDGVVDRLDKCPDKAGQPPAGCPVEEKKFIVITGDKIDLKQKVQFATGKAVINKASFPLLDEVAEVLKSRQKLELRIEGHTDNKGNAKKNLKLSEDRAQAVLKYLVKAGIDAGRLTAQGYGDTRPLGDNKSEAGREKNRRTEFFITKQ